MRILRKQSLLFFVLALLVFSVNSHLHPLFHSHFGNCPEIAFARGILPDECEVASAEESRMHPGIFCPFCHFGSSLLSEYDTGMVPVFLLPGGNTVLYPGVFLRQGRGYSTYGARAPPFFHC